MRSWLLVIFGVVLSVLVISTIIYSRTLSSHRDASNSSPIGSTEIPPSPIPVSESSIIPSNTPSMTPSGTPDLTSDPASGLSKATVVMSTSEGTIKFKFYSSDAPKTTHRIAELISQGFYNGLTFHKIFPGFVIQGGDPKGNGSGGSGQRLDAEFNNRKHIEGTIAMARAPEDVNSADSQFFISLGTHPNLDRKYTVFGQVIEGMDTAKKIKVGSKMINVHLE